MNNQTQRHIKGKSAAFERIRVKSSDAEGIIPYYTRRLLKKVYRASGNGLIGRYLSSYDAAEKGASECFIVKKPRQLYARITASKRRRPRTEVLPEEADSVVIYKEESVPRRFTDIVSKQWYSSRIIS